MNFRLTGLSLAALAGSAWGHRLDEYLQATTISLEPGRVLGEVRLTPGVAVYKQVLAGIDTDKDGRLNSAEQAAYAQRVVRDQAMALDGQPLTLKLDFYSFPPLDQMQEGMGEIHIYFEAALPGGYGSKNLHYENHHHPDKAAYLVNCLVPSNHTLAVTGQKRDFKQSRYDLSFTSEAPSSPPIKKGLPVGVFWVSGAGIAGLSAWGAKSLRGKA